VDKKRNENRRIETEERWEKEVDWSFQQVNDYPFSDKTLVVNPQSIPLTADESSPVEIRDI